MPEMKKVMAHNMVLCEVTDWAISSTLQKTEKIGPEQSRVEIYAYSFPFSYLFPFFFSFLFSFFSFFFFFFLFSFFFLCLSHLFSVDLSSQKLNLSEQRSFTSPIGPTMALLFHSLFFYFPQQRPGFFFFLFI